MNRTVLEIVKSAYWEAKTAFECKKNDLDFAVNNRAEKERQLAAAKLSEEEAAVRCQRAANKLKDLAEFLKSTGVFT